MIRQEFRHAVSRVSFLALCAAILSWSIVLGALALFIWWASDFDEAQRVLVASVGLILFSLQISSIFLAIWWIHRRFGVRCPGCDRVLSANWPRVLKTGQCHRCKLQLFRPLAPDPNLLSKVRYERRFATIAFLAGLGFTYVVIAASMYMYDVNIKDIDWTLLVLPAVLFGALGLCGWVASYVDEKEVRSQPQQ